MATQYHNLSEYEQTTIPDASTMRIGIVVAEWNREITSKLLDGAVQTLTENGVLADHILVDWVPGSFELVYGAKRIASENNLSAVIVLGCVIRGETPHFEYICSGVTQGIVQLNLSKDIPFIFGLLTNENMQQSIDRAGGIHGNKGVEAAITALRMASLNRKTR